MAANLGMSGNVAEMAYVGSEGAPWHGLGVVLDGPATSKEMIAAAGMDWRSELHEMYLDTGRLVGCQKAVVRSDTKAILGTVGVKYRPVQNAEAFDFMDGLVSKEAIRYHTAGCLGNGERVWALAKFNGDVRIGGTDDIVSKYLLLANSHDGSSCVSVLWTPIRVVCQNTLSSALNGSRNTMRITHTRSATAKLAQASDVLGLTEAFYEAFTKRAAEMVGRPLNRVAALTYFKSVVPESDEKEHERAAHNARATHARLMQLWDEGIGADMPGVRHTLWMAYNAVTEFTDHAEIKETRTRTLEDARDARLASVWFGAGASLKTKAFAEAMAVLRN